MFQILKGGHWSDKMDKGNIVGIIIISFVVLTILINQNIFESDEEKFQKGMIRTRDDQFIKFIESSSANIENHLANISNNKERDYNISRMHGIFLQEDIKIYMNQSKDLNISPELEPILNEFQRYLENYYNVGKYIVMGLENSNDNYMQTAINYSEKGYENMGNISKGIERYMITR